MTNLATSSSSSARRSKAFVTRVTVDPERGLVSSKKGGTDRTSVPANTSGAAVFVASNANALGTWTCTTYRSGSWPAKNRAQR